MRKLLIIGIGAGHPDYVTIQAIKALNKVDVFFFMDKGEVKEGLIRLRREICERYIEQPTYRIVEVADPVRDPAVADYTARVEQWHLARVLIYEALLTNELTEDQTGAILVWGDPSLYDSTLRMVDQMTSRANVLFDYEVIPGITSIQALAARHKTPLNGIGESVLITTGRRLSSVSFNNADSVVVMLDGDCSFQNLISDDLEILWAAYLGMDDEILLSGPLSEIAEMIESTRAEARRRNGWIMDIYLLRKCPSQA